MESREEIFYAIMESVFFKIIYMKSRLSKTIAYVVLIGIIGVCLGIILAVSGLPIKKLINTTADWKTYYDSEYGFRFRYPPDWQLAVYSEPVLSIEVAKGNEAFTVLPFSPDPFPSFGQTRRIVVSGKTATVASRYLNKKKTRAFKEVGFYDFENFRIQLYIDLENSKDETTRIFKTFEFIQ